MHRPSETKTIRHIALQCGETLLAGLEELRVKLSVLQTSASQTVSSADAPVFERELNYLRKHGAAGHLSYVKYTRRGLLLGSGAVESAIRRVINLRLKSNGMFWTPENAEKILQLRCQLLSTQWSVADSHCLTTKMIEAREERSLERIKRTLASLDLLILGENVESS